MIIVRFQGGLGNQIFQYALYEKLKYYYKDTVILADMTSYRTSKPHNGYELDKVFEVFGLKKATDREIFSVRGQYPFVGMNMSDSINALIRSIAYKFFSGSNRIISYVNKTTKERIAKSDSIIFQNYESGYVEPESIYKLDSAKNWYFDGTWFNCDYSVVLDKMQLALKFRDQIKGNENIQLLHEIGNTQSVSIHVRRGDYSTWHYLILGMDYYERAIAKINASLEKPHFFVFSDDLDTVIKEFYELSSFDPEKFTFVKGNSGEHAWMDLLLMTECKHHIIANSTFSAAATLVNHSKDGLIIAPTYWMENKETWNAHRWLKL